MVLFQDVVLSELPGWKCDHLDVAQTSRRKCVKSFWPNKFSVIISICEFLRVKRSYIFQSQFIC